MKTYREFLEMVTSKRDEVLDFITEKKIEYIDGYPDVVVQLWMNEDGEMFETYNPSSINLVSDTKRVVQLLSFHPGWGSEMISEERENIMYEKYPDVESEDELTPEQIKEIEEEALEGVKNIEIDESYTLDMIIDRLEDEVKLEEEYNKYD